MPPIHRSPRSRRAALAATASAATVASAAALATAAPGALAGPYEQVTRATGAQGAAAFTGSNQPLAVSDSGRYAVFSPRGYSMPPKIPVILRDIVANTTTTLAPNAIVIGFDRAETRFATVELDAGGETSSIWVRPIAGGPGKKVTTLDPFAAASYAFSGNGNVVAVAEEWGALKLYDVATGNVLRTIDQTGLSLGPRSLSDDGKIVAGTKDWSQGFYVKANGTVINLDSPALVSPNGAVVISGAGLSVVATKVADGTSRTYDSPTGSVVWVAPDGGSLIAGDNDTEGGGAQKLTLATGAWSAYGNVFSADLDGNLLDPVNATQSAISRNGKYAVVQYARGLSNQLALVNLSGGDLPGAQEALSASSYFPFTPPLSFSCATQPEANLIGLYKQPASWVPKPRLGALQIRVDGKTVLNKAFTKPFDVNDPSSSGSSISVPFSTSAKSIRISAAVLDDQFRPLADTELTAPICIGGFSGE